MKSREIPFFFEVGGSALLGIASVPRAPARLGVVIVVGGPQYRVGSHRQFVLLARTLADAGIAAFRFDYRGMGDSEGPAAGFTAVDADIRAAIDAFFARLPSLERVVLWGLCDGASASAFYAGTDERVAGLALYNPWVRTERGEARVMLSHYYARRFFDPGFWHKLFGGGVQWRESTSGLWSRIAKAAFVRARAETPDNGAAIDLPCRLASSIAAEGGPVLVALSGNDTVAAEFKAHSAGTAALATSLARQSISRVDFPGVDHTFSRAEWRAAGADATLAWLRSQFAQWLLPARAVVLVPPEVK
ncbi:MAG: hydrolase 1, exosortase A system-associated [Casimicrobiaceae bacterium]